MKLIKDIKYNDFDECLLDIYLPDGAFSKTIVHFHGGGIESGSKDDEPGFTQSSYYANHGVACIQVNYRMYPNASYPDFLKDAALAIRYVYDHIEDYGGCKDLLYVSGQSAGAYFAAMLALKKDLLADVNLNVLDIAGWFIDSAQMTAHFNVLKEFGIDPRRQQIDEYAPLYYLDQDTKFNAMKLIFYTNDIPCRYEQNMLFYKAVLNYDPNAKINYQVLEGTHCDASCNKVDGLYPICPLTLEFVLNN